MALTNDPALMNLHAAWKSSLQASEGALLAILQAALPEAGPGHVPNSLVFAVPGGDSITAWPTYGATTVTVHAQQVPVAVAQALVDQCTARGWFDMLVTPDGKLTGIISEADPDEYGAKSQNRLSEDVLRVSATRTADLELYGIEVPRAVAGLAAARTMALRPAVASLRAGGTS